MTLQKFKVSATLKRVPKGVTSKTNNLEPLGNVKP